MWYRVSERRPEDKQKVLVSVNPIQRDPQSAIARYGKDGTLRWRFDLAGWLDAHPNDEWSDE